jgi:hypothetical protein
MSATRILDLAARGERNTNRLCAGAIGVSASRNIDRRTAAPGMARRRLPPNRADHTQPNGDHPGGMAEELYAKWVTSARRADESRRPDQRGGNSASAWDLINAGPRGGPRGSAAPAGPISQSYAGRGTNRRLRLGAVAKELGARSEDIYLREAANVSNVRKLPLNNYRVVYFATHDLASMNWRSSVCSRVEERSCQTGKRLGTRLVRRLCYMPKAPQSLRSTSASPLRLPSRDRHPLRRACRVWIGQELVQPLLSQTSQPHQRSPPRPVPIAA